MNKNYNPDPSYTGPVISPPKNQPIQKSYKDWNTSYPENSWEISEVGIYVNAAYVKLLSKFADSTSVTSENETFSESNNIFIYPNPANGIINVIAGPTFSGTKQSHFTMYNLFGEEVDGKQLAARLPDGQVGKNQIDVSGLKSGIYLLKIENTEGVQTKKIVINR